MTPAEDDPIKRGVAEGILRMRAELARDLRQAAAAIDDPAEDWRIFDAPAARQALEQAERPVRRAAMQLRRLLFRVRGYEQKYPDADGAGAGVLR